MYKEKLKANKLEYIPVKLNRPRESRLLVLYN
jgi:hypothetical protein